MTYARSNVGPGDIGALRSGIGLTMGPTIGSNDPRISLSGLGVLQRTPTSLLAPTRIVEGVSKVRPNTGQSVSNLTAVPSPEMDTMNLTEPVVDETPTQDGVVTPPPGLPTWAWVVGGVVGLGLIGGIAYVLLK